MVGTPPVEKNTQVKNFIAHMSVVGTIGSAAGALLVSVINPPNAAPWALPMFMVLSPLWAIVYLLSHE